MARAEILSADPKQGRLVLLITYPNLGKDAEYYEFRALLPGMAMTRNEDLLYSHVQLDNPGFVLPAGIVKDERFELRNMSKIIFDSA